MKKRLLGVLLAFAVYVSFIPVTAVATGDAIQEEATYQENENGEWKTGTFTDAIDKVYSGGTVKLLKDILLTGTATIQKSMTIMSDDADNPCKISCNTSEHGYLLNVSETGATETYAPATATLKNITIDGGSQNNISATRALIAVNGRLILEAGATLQNNNNITTNGVGGGICLISGSVEMRKGSRITGNKAEQGGGVAIVNTASNVFNMTGGEICNNTATTATPYGKGGGGLYQETGTFYMSGGSIQDNTAPLGGGIFLTTSNPTFQLSNGNIIKNNANYGGGIYVNSCNLLEMKGGSVTENVAKQWGGGALIAPGSSIVLAGSISIIDNSNSSNSVGEDLYLDGYTDGDIIHMPTAKLNQFDSDAKVSLYSWLKPIDEDALTVFTAVDNYSITSKDYAKLSYEDEDYKLELRDNTIVLIKVIPIETVELDKTEVSLFKGDSEQLSATITPDNATYQEISWSSSDPNVATVDESGKIIAVGVGEAIITATTKDGKTANCKVAVTKKPSGSVVSPTYPPTITESDNGGVTVSPTAPKSGDTVTITPKPDEGYEIDSITITDKSGKSIAVTDNGDGTYRFTQPSGAVTITVTYKKIGCPKDATCPISKFSDASATAWYHDGVHYCLMNGLMAGHADGTFEPNGSLTRAQLAQILYNRAGKPAVTSQSTFTDVASDAWYAAAITWAQQTGIVDGVGDNQFAPDQPVTREQLAAMLYRDAGKPAVAGTITGFADAADVSAWAQDAMLWATQNGILNGDRQQDGSLKLKAKAGATRAEAATMLEQYDNR